MTEHSGEPVFHLLPESESVCVVVPRLFSGAECAGLLTDSVKRSFQKAIASYPTYYRNNDRLVIDSEPLAQQLFEKVRPFLPDSLPSDAGHSESQEIWHLKGLNSRFRYCRYRQGQYFNRHLDGVYYQSERVQSMLTFMLYLNGANEFEGGRTLFYPSKDSPEIWAAYLPQAGDLIIFDHNLWHEGEVLTAGEKYVLRSDVLYERKGEEASAASPVLSGYQEGHLGYIWKLLPFDNRLLISGGRDKVIKVWDENGVCCQHLTGHQHSILCLAKINDRVFLSGSRDQSIKAWQREASGFALKAEWHLHQALVLSLCRIDDQTFASSSGDCSIRLVTLTGEIIRILTGHQDWVWNVIRLTHQRLASCSEDGTIRIWDTATGNCLVTFRETCPVHCLVFDEENARLISGNFRGEITCRKADASFTRWQIEQTFVAHQGIVRALLLINGRCLASGGEDNRVKVWELVTATRLTDYPHANFVQALALGDRNQLLSASYDGRIGTWELPAQVATAKYRS